MSTIIGLDLSLTSTGIVVLSGDSSIHNCVISSKAIGELIRLYDITSRVLQKCDVFTPSLVCIEGYAFGMPGRANSLTQLAEVAGVIKLEFYKHNVHFRIIPPATVKKFATGRGNAKKDEMRLAVFKKWGFEAPTTDEVDAFVLAQIGRALLGEADLLAYEKEALSKLQKGDE